MSDVAYALGRIAVTVVFIVFGYIQVMNIGNYVTNAAVVKFAAETGNVLSPTVVAWMVALVDLIGGLLLLIGFKTRWAALVLIVFVASTIWFAHPFWTMEGTARAGNQAHALKNLAIIGALLVFAAYGGGRYSVDGMRRRA
jgi:putative oxidoreductase